MCDCVERIQKDIVEKQPFSDLKVISAELPRTFIVVEDQLVVIPYLTVELECEGRKRPVTRSLLYSFCPLCGEKINKGEKSHE